MFSQKRCKLTMHSLHKHITHLHIFTNKTALHILCSQTSATLLINSNWVKSPTCHHKYVPGMLAHRPYMLSTYWSMHLNKITPIIISDNCSKPLITNQTSTTTTECASGDHLLGDLLCSVLPDLLDPLSVFRVQLQLVQVLQVLQGDRVQGVGPTGSCRCPWQNQCRLVDTLSPGNVLRSQYTRNLGWKINTLACL